MGDYRNTVNGQPVAVVSYQKILNPATGALLGEAPLSSDDDVEEAVAAARQAQKAWAATSDQQRRELVNQVADVLEENAEYLAGLITQEQGKPLSGPG